MKTLIKSTTKSFNKENAMMNNKTSIAASVSHCNTPSITYYEVGVYERYENDTVLKRFHNEENAKAYLAQLMARKQELINELMKYPLRGRYDLDIYNEEGNYKWGDIFDDIDIDIIVHCKNYVEYIKQGREEDAKDALAYSDYYCCPITIDFSD